MIWSNPHQVCNLIINHHKLVKINYKLVKNILDVKNNYQLVKFKL